MPSHHAPGFSLADLAVRWKCGLSKLRELIRRGELVATNIALDVTARPQWRVSAESVGAFERRRSSQPAPTPKRRRGRRPDAVKNFFPD
jgi:hypothetical protein